MKNISNNFQHDNPFTIGVEEEYMLCHPESGELINRADEIINNLSPDLKSRYSYELILSEIEINTSVCNTVSEAIKEILYLRNNTREIGNKYDFNKGLAELEMIINKMESGDLSLEDSLKYFEKGVKLHRECHRALKDAEQRVNILNEADNYSEEKPLDDL